VRSQGRRARRDSLPRSDRGIQGGRGAAPPLLTSLNPRECKAFAHRSAGQSDHGHAQTSLLLERPSPSRPPLSEAGSSSRAFAFGVTFAGVPSGHDGPRRDPRSQHLPTLTVMSKPTNARECQTSVSPLGLRRRMLQLETSPPQGLRVVCDRLGCPSWLALRIESERRSRPSAPAAGKLFRRGSSTARRSRPTRAGEAVAGGPAARRSPLPIRGWRECAERECVRFGTR
jgi:hypothetical protein